jgi:predicted DNA-binding transcriptional regulator AlpA
MDVLISNTKAARRLGVTTRSIFRWVQDPELNFPKPCFINGRRYFSEGEIDLWRDSRIAAPSGAVFRGSPVPRGARDSA